MIGLENILNMLRENETEITEITRQMKNKIINYFSNGGGIYRMNTVGANYYSFTFYKDEKGKIDFCGSFDWGHTVSTNFSWVYDSEKNKFMKTSDFIKRKK